MSVLLVLREKRFRGEGDITGGAESVRRDRRCR